MADPERSLTAKLTSTWEVLVKAMGEETAQQFRDYLRSRGLDVLPIEYGVHAVVTDLHLTPSGTPVGNVSIRVDRLGYINLDRLRIKKDKVTGTWGLMMGTDKYERDGKLVSEARARVTGQYATAAVKAMLEACVEANLLPPEELGRVRKRSNPPGERRSGALQRAIGNVTDYQVQK